MDPTQRPMNGKYEQEYKHPLVKENSADSFMNEPANPYAGATPLRNYTPLGHHRATSSDASRERLVTGAAPLGGSGGSPPPHDRQPTLPNFGQPQAYGGSTGGYRGVTHAY
jgi:hypothetical protein